MQHGVEIIFIWMSKYNHCIMWNVITHPTSAQFNLTLELGHEWIITFHFIMLI